MRWVGGLILSFALSGCAFSPKKFSEEKEGYWQAKVLVKEKASARSYIVNVDFNAMAGKALRMDVTAAMGEHVASLAINQDELEYLLVRQKKFYTGKSGAGSLKPILSAPLDPRILENILFDQPIADKDWSCTKDKDNYLTECRQARTELLVKWGERKGRRRTVFVEHPTAQLQLNFYSFQPKVEARNDLFELKPPPGFEVVKLK